MFHRKWLLFFCLNLVIQVKRLPVGDGIWIARHKKFLTEYVLDFIVERKNVADLGSSIRDNRYKDQKTRLQVLYGLALTTCYCYRPWMSFPSSLYLHFKLLNIPCLCCYLFLVMTPFGSWVWKLIIKKNFYLFVAIVFHLQTVHLCSNEIDG